MLKNVDSEILLDVHVIHQCWVEVFEFFSAEPEAEKKTNLWFNTHNPNIGCTPISLLLMGRGHKLLKVIKALKEGY